jgi:hypothetical protein
MEPKMEQTNKQEYQSTSKSEGYLLTLPFGQSMDALCAKWNGSES